MHIPSLQPARSFFSQKKQGNTKTDQLQKADHISDIFNHRPKDEGEKKGAHVHLSNASCSLHEQLGVSIKKLLKKNPDLAAALDHIPLPEHDHLSLQASFVAKARSYVSWVQQKQETGGGDAVYQQVQKQDPDSLLEKIFHSFTQKKEQMVKERQQALPNYYYLVYPETYSFN